MFRLTIHVEPKVEVENGRVYCEGREVGELVEGNWDERTNTYRMNVRIDDEGVRNAITQSLVGNLKAVIEELRTPVEPRQAYRVEHDPACQAGPEGGSCLPGCHWVEVPMEFVPPPRDPAC